MAFEISQLLEVIGLEKAETIEEVKAHIEKSFVPTALMTQDERFKKQAGALIGKRIGEAETRLNATFKKMGIELDDAKDKKFEELLEGYTEKLEVKHKELAEAVGKGDDAKVEQLQKQVEKLTKAVAEKDTFLNNAVAEKTKVEQEYFGFKTNLQKTELVTKAWAQVPFSETANDLAKKGFQALISDKYEVRLPTEGEDATKDGLVVIDKTTNERPKNNVGYVPFVEILQNEAKAVGVAKVGGHNTPPAKVQQKPAIEPINTPQRKNRAEGHSEALRERL
jgi:hypothetical protein